MRVSLALVSVLALLLPNYVAPSSDRISSRALRRHQDRSKNAMRKNIRPVKRPEAPVDKTYTFPLFVSGDGDDFYQIVAAVGSPPQLFNLTLLSEHIETALLGKGIKTNMYAGCKAKSEGRRRYYNKSASTTAKPWRTEYFLDSGWLSGEPLVDHLNCQNRFDGEGNATTDQMQVCSSFTASGCTDGPSQALDIAVVFEIDQALSDKWAADGIFGTNPEQAFESDEVGTFTKFLSSFLKPIYSLSIDRRDFSQTGNQPAGALTIGGSSDAGCDGKWFNVGGGPYSQYGISIVGTEFGTSVSQDKHDTYLTYSTAYLHVSSDLLNTVVIALHAEYDFPSDQYLVDCGAVKTAPPLALFTAAGTPLAVPPTDYIRQFTPKGKCVLMFTDEDLQIGSIWYLGSTLLRGYCMHYDDSSWNLQFSKKLVK